MKLVAGEARKMQRLGVAGDDLSPMQRRFVNAFVAQGCTNGTKAAEDAGYSTRSKGSLYVAASKLLAEPKVQAAIQAMTGKAIAKAERKAIADLTECLEYLTAVKRARLTDYLHDDGSLDMEKLRTAPEGLVRRLKIITTTEGSGDKAETETRHELEVESALSAAKTLVEHYTRAEAPPPQTQVNILAILGQLSSETLRDLKGATAKARAIDITPEAQP